MDAWTACVVLYATVETRNQHFPLSLLIGGNAEQAITALYIAYLNQKTVFHCKPESSAINFTLDLPECE